jgi:hypothetical protein
LKWRHISTARSAADRFFFKIDVLTRKLVSWSKSLNRTTSTTIPQADPVVEASTVTEHAVAGRAS